jgi:hypothetical protein
MIGKRNTTFLKTSAVLVCLIFTTSGFAAYPSSARIIPSGKVSIIKDGTVVSQFSQEAPLPEGSLLRCEGKCAIKLGDVYMVADPGTVFSVESTATGHSLYVQQGTMYYSMTESSRPISFNTPAGNATTGEIALNDSDLKGYVRVAGNKSEVGVIGGGTMTLETESGELTVASGKKITMTAAEHQKAVATTNASGGMSKKTQYIIGAVAAGVAVAGGIALASSGGGGGSSSSGGSPAAP